MSHPWPGGAAPSVSSKHALIMDEVDGMAGSEDRGGIQVTALYLFFFLTVDFYRLRNMGYSI